MQLFHWQVEGGNFGDDMNLWFWDALMPGWRDCDPGATLFGIGTILSSRALGAATRPVIFGSGTGYEGVSAGVLEKARIVWLRGPRTAARLGVSPDLALADPAIMLPQLDEMQAPVAATALPLFVPHHTTAALPLDWARIGQRAGVEVVLPGGDARSVIDRLRAAPLVIAESMHAAIIADAFRTPWVALRISNKFNEFKWNDWADSLGIELEIGEGLAPLKRGYAHLRSAQGALRRLVARPAAPTRPGTATKPAATATLHPRPEGKREAMFLKSAIRRTAPLIERMLATDLRRAAAAPPRQSDAAQLALRQEQIAARIAAWRGGG